MSKVVTFAKLHAPIFIPGVGNLKETLMDSAESTKGIVMELTNDGLYCTYKNVKFLVPTPMITHMVLGKNESGS